MKKAFIFFFCICSITFFVQGQSVGIGTSTPNSTAQLDISSNSKGVLIPRLTTAQRDAITNPANGLMIYNSTTKQYNFHNGTRWQNVNGMPRGAIVLGENYDDSTIKNEGFKYTGYISHDMNSQVIGDTTFAAFTWYKGNTYYADNAGAQSCNQSVVSIFIDSLLYCFGYDSVFAYNRNGDKWKSIPINSAGVINYLTSTTDIYRAGSRIIFWSMMLTKGFRYNYLSNVWDTISATNAPGPREYYSSLTTGAEMIVWGGRIYDFNTATYTYPAEGYRYNTSTNAWTVISSPPGFQGRMDCSMAFTNNGFLVWGGRRVFEVTGTISCSGTQTYQYDSSAYYTDGRFYNMLINTWVTVPASGAPAARHNAAIVFDGTNVVITGGRLHRPAHPYCGFCNTHFCVLYNYNDSVYKSGAKYSPASNEWLPVPDAPRPFTDVYPLWDNDQYMTMFIGDDTTLSFEPSADDWFINLYPTLNAGFISSKFNSYAVNNSDFIIFNPYWSSVPSNIPCWASRKAVYNFRPVPITVRTVKSSQIMPATKLYLYKKE